MTKNEKEVSKVPPEWASLSKRNKAFREGYVAFIHGKFINPYNDQEQFIDNREWTRGWNRSYKTKQDEKNGA